MKDKKSLSRTLSEEAHNKGQQHSIATETKRFQHSKNELWLFFATLLYVLAFGTLHLILLLNQRFDLLGSIVSKIEIVKIVIYPVSIFIVLQAMKLLVVALIGKRIRAIPALLICVFAGMLPWAIFLLPIG